MHTATQERTVGKQGGHDTVVVSGEVEIITYCNPESGWTVVKLRVGDELKHEPFVDSKGRASVVGSLASLRVGDSVAITGKLTMHSQFGYQLNAISYDVAEVNTSKDVLRWLDRAKLIGPVKSKLIYNHFGDDLFNVFENEIDRVKEVEGIGKKCAAAIKEAWEARKGETEVMRFMRTLTDSEFIRNKIEAHFRKASWLKPEDIIRIITDDPYLLARKIKGIGFKTADEIAKRLNVPEISDKRIIGAATHVLSERSQTNGDVFCYLEDVAQAVCDFLAHHLISADMVKDSIELAVERGVFVRRENRLYLTHLYDREESIIELLEGLMVHSGGEYGKPVDRALADAITASDVPLDDIQQDAIRRSLSSKVSLISGGPGTGKSTITKSLVSGFRAMDLDVYLAAPTGRAAKRMTEVIGEQAYTCHRLFKIGATDRPKKITRPPAGVPLDTLPDEGVVPDDEGSEDDPITISEGVLILDEFSMVDMWLFERILKRIHPRVRLVLIGDKDQLPSIGAGSLLRDLLNVHEVPKTILTKIYRQAERSDIVVSAHAINQGRDIRAMYLSRDVLQSPALNEHDMFVLYTENPELQMRQAVWAATSFAQQMGFDPAKDVQVITPQRRGPIGVQAMNLELQRAINPGSTKSFEGKYGQMFAVGDRTMQTKNDYEYGLFNGDICTIKDVWFDNGKPKTVILQCDSDEIQMPAAVFNGCQVLAYATTVHKSQGGQYPFVICMLHTGHFTMLQRNLLYTAITRGQRLALLITHPDALSMAIRNNKVGERNSTLQSKLTMKLNAPRDVSNG